MNKVPYLEWEQILLDTSIIFSYFNAVRVDTDIRCNFVKRVVDDLINKKSTNGKERQFYISSISISEMYDKVADISKTKKIISHLNTQNVIFHPFDTDIAEYMTSNYHQLLGKDELHECVRDINWPNTNMALAKEWITRDLMILATADFLKCDVVLTLDKRTMLPLAKKVGYYCAVVESENFNHNSTYIFEHTA